MGRGGRVGGSMAECSPAVTKAVPASWAVCAHRQVQTSRVTQTSLCTCSNENIRTKPTQVCTRERGSRPLPRWEWAGGGWEGPQDCHSGFWMDCLLCSGKGEMFLCSCEAPCASDPKACGFLMGAAMANHAICAFRLTHLPALALGLWREM